MEYRIINILSEKEICKLWWTVSLAIAVFVVPLVLHLLKKLYRYCFNKQEDVTEDKFLLFVTVISLISVFLLRYSVGLYKCYIGSEDALLWWEELSNSLVHALQTFSMDEDYTSYIVTGREMMLDISENSMKLANWFSGFVLIMNIVAPIAGGAMLLDILTSLLPNIKLFFLHRFYLRRKYYFSKLNERSLALAESIMKAYRAKKGIKFKPVIIFCDVYTDPEDEKNTELIAGAKAIGSVCVKDDLLHVSKNRFKNRTFMLIDDVDNEINNLKMFTGLANGKNAKKLKYSEVFLFSQSDMHTIVENKVYRKLMEEYGVKKSQLPIVTPVKCYTNLVCNLLADLPLYEPLVEEKKQGKPLELNVSVFGDGVTGMEMILSSYWFGQILDCQLNINVFSQGSEEDFREKLDNINPDILKSTVPFSDILANDSMGNCNLPYCKINYIQGNVNSASFFEETENRAMAVKSHYIFVALGNDEINIAVANKLRESIGRYHLSEGNTNRTVIAYVVYDTGLCDALNRENCFDYSLSDTKPDIYMMAIGSLHSVYSVENVFCTKHEISAEKIGHHYDIIAGKADRKAEFNQKLKKDDYSRWADRARAMHIKYKMFAAGLITTSVFETGGVDDAAYTEALNNSLKKYAELSVSTDTKKESIELLQRLAWMEHRRWVAFLRIKGFKSTDRYEEYMTKEYNRQEIPCKKPDHKYISLKLHPFLVESKIIDPDITEGYLSSLGDFKADADGINKMYEKLWTMRLEKCADNQGYDKLDEVSYKLSKLKNDMKTVSDATEHPESSSEESVKTFVADYKQYDYPSYDDIDGILKK